MWAVALRRTQALIRSEQLLLLRRSLGKRTLVPDIKRVAVWGGGASVGKRLSVEDKRIKIYISH